MTRLPSSVVSGVVVMVVQVTRSSEPWSFQLVPREGFARRSPTAVRADVFFCGGHVAEPDGGGLQVDGGAGIGPDECVQPSPDAWRAAGWRVSSTKGSGPHETERLGGLGIQ